MMEVTGKFNTAKIYTDVVDEASIAQDKELCDQEFSAGSRIRLMPDIHAGAGCTIGTTMTIKDKICPNIVGVDIGCGMETVRIMEDRIDFEKLDKLIRKEIPSGFNIRSSPHWLSKYIHLNELYCAKHVNIDRAYNSIGTLGGGNHFIEADKDEDGGIYIVVHSGSRHLGLEIANYYQRWAYDSLTFAYCTKDVKNIVDMLKSYGRANEIERTLKEMKSKRPTVLKHLAYVEGELFEQYLHDMKIAQEFAKMNRMAIVATIMKGMGFHEKDHFTTVHNYIDIENMILRKGAVSAKDGEQLLIPINMRDGSLICVGKGNEDWNYSAPHGAGRLMSRAQAKKSFTVEDFKEQMQDVYTTSVDDSTLDECPMAYKGMEDILGNIGPTAEVVKAIKPIYNFKAGV